MSILFPEYVAPIYKFALRADLVNNKEFLPTRGEPKATGWDVRAAMHDGKPLIVKPLQQVKIPLGIRGFCPEGWWYELKPRSSTFGKKNLHALYGTVDETYEGELIFAAQYIPHFPFHAENFVVTEEKLKRYFNEYSLEINFGDAIGQIIPVKRQEMQVVEVSNEEYDANCTNRAGVRGAGGFGSTDVKK